MLYLFSKYRKKSIYVELRSHLGEVFRDLAKRKGCEIEEGHVMSGHVHMLIAIPPKYAVSQVIGYMKGKAAIYIARNFAGRKRNFVVQHFWARGYFVSTVGRIYLIVIYFISFVYPVITASHTINSTCCVVTTEMQMSQADFSLTTDAAGNRFTS